MTFVLIVFILTNPLWNGLKEIQIKLKLLPIFGDLFKFSKFRQAWMNEWTIEWMNKMNECMCLCRANGKSFCKNKFSTINIIGNSYSFRCQSILRESTATKKNKKKKIWTLAQLFSVHKMPWLLSLCSLSDEYND